MRVLLWHGWLLEGSGSSIYAARTAEVLRDDGHDVALVCQERHPERYAWIDASATVDAGGVSALEPNPLATGAPSGSRCVLFRPSIGPTLPVFVVDVYVGFDDVRRFVDLDDATIESYLGANVEALARVAAWHATEVAIAGHAIPGAVVAARALGRAGVPYVAKIHGSDLEYAIREQPRLASLAAEGLRAARAVVGASRDVLDRCAELIPGLPTLGPVVPPGVDVAVFHPRPRAEALADVATRLRRDPDVERGRPTSLDTQVRDAVERRDTPRLDELAATYDQAVPEQGAAEALERLGVSASPLVGSFGKLIAPKGVHLLLEASRRATADHELLIVGFGSFREWLGAYALAEADTDALEWLGRDMPDLDVAPSGAARRVTFTGRLDHRYAGEALASMDVLVVPSVLEEAFGMVAIEGAASGALPIVARHSGLAEIAEAIEGEVGLPGAFSYEPGAGSAGRISERLDALLSMPADERRDLAERVTAFVGRAWSWRATARALLEAAR
jgi:glycosyltransferase involved in cell wall biosynthesis